MRNAILYVSTVLIWGSTWLAIEYQVGQASVFASVFYRFAIAAVLMWAYCLCFKVNMRFSLKGHTFILLLALFNFSLNYVLIYQSQVYLTSAMTCIVFSTMLVMNIVNTKLFFGDTIAPKVYAGAALGLLGLVVLFWNDLKFNDSGAFYGLAFGLGAALVASIGNMVSVRNSRANMNLLAVNAWGMLYGTLALALMIVFTGADFSASWQTEYILSLLYLAVFGTVIAFATYYALLNDMGPEKASYAIVLFPAVAVLLSSLFEDFTWSSNTFLGFTLVLVGNAVILTPIDKIKLWACRLSSSTVS